MQSKHDQNSLQELNNQISDINAIDESGMTLLLEAIYEKDLDTVRDLLAKGANPNLPGSNAFPPLVAATALNSEEIVALLLSHPNIDVNQHQGQLKTALYVAAAKGYKTVMEQLLLFNTLQSIEVNINGSKHSPLFIAIYNKHEELALLLMERFPESINISTEKGYTPLHLAAQRGDLEIITKLLKAGANQPGQPNTHTPLTFALSNNHEEIACLLIQKFSEWVNLPDENENSPLLIAVANGLCNAAIQLIENKAELNWSGHTLLSVAIELRKSINNIEFISSLISRYPKLVNQPNEKGVYPLHLAAQEGQDDVVEQLLTHGADPFVKCETTPLIPAIFNKHKHVIDLLIQRYPLLANQPREMDGLTPLLFAVQEGNIDLV